MLVKLKLVDCENWDLFAVLEGRAGKSKKQARKLERHEAAGVGRVRRAGREDVESEAERADSRSRDRSRTRSAAALRTLRHHLELGETEAALAVYQKSSRRPRAGSRRSGLARPHRGARSKPSSGIDAAQVMRDYVRERPSHHPRSG